MPGPGIGDLYLYNGYNCVLKIKMLPNLSTKNLYTPYEPYIIQIKELEVHVETELKAGISYKYKTQSICAGNDVKGHFDIKSGIQAGYYFKENETNASHMVGFKENTSFTQGNKNPKIRILVNSAEEVSIQLKTQFELTQAWFKNMEMKTVPANIYDMFIKDKFACQIDARVGFVYAVMIVAKNGTLDYVSVQESQTEYLIIAASNWQNQKL